MSLTIIDTAIILFGVIFANIAGGAGNCQTVFVNKVSDQDRTAIVDTHNGLRAQIANGEIKDQPRAINLGPLQWDNKLADEAQKIANTCEFKHVAVNDDRFYVGQNLLMSFSSGKMSNDADWKGGIQGWFSEHKDFTYPTTSRGVTGHYTQVVWADTKYIGCGFTYSQNNGRYEKLYVCNYGPGGNYVGQAPYKV